MMMGDLQSEFPDDDQSKKLPEEKDAHKSYLRCADAIDDNDLSRTEEVKQNGLSLPDTGQPLIDKLPISSSIVKKIPSKNVVAVCTSPPSTDSDEIDALKRASKLDTLDLLEKQKAGFVESNDDIELKFENRVFEHVGLAGFTNGTNRKKSIPSESFEPLPFLSNRSISSFSKLIQQDPNYWSSLEDALSAKQRSEPNKPVLLESGDSSFNSSSTEDGSIELIQMQKSFDGNPFSQKSYRPMQENQGRFTRKLEKLPKEDKEEVDKFLKGFSRSPLVWTSDTEESSSSEDSSVDEEKMSRATGMKDCRSSASEVMQEKDVRVQYKSITDMNFDPIGPRSDERLDSNSKKNHLKQDTYLVDAWLPLRQKHSHNTDKTMNVQNDRASFKQSQSLYESGNLQGLSTKEFQTHRLEHTSVNTEGPILDLIENAGDSEQQDLLPIVAVEFTKRPALCESKVDQLCQENDRDRELTKMETAVSKKSKDISEAGVSKHEIVFLYKAHGDVCKDYDFVHDADADKESHSGLSENDSALVHKADQNGFPGATVHDQDQETISYVPTIEGLVLEQCMASNLAKDDCRIENSEASSEEADGSSSAKVVDLTAISSDEHSSCNCLTFNKTQTDSLPVALSTQFDPGHKVQMKESGMDLSNNTSKLLDTIGEDIKSTDLAPIPISGVNLFSGAITQSGSIPFSGSISLRSDSSNNSTRSFAFPMYAILAF
ncbi:hypothetical protein O6H91_17G090500 [Diphasiastrum complanatum]|uniref:Uncharacterized protein n=1 Tax=Diphasiastrum complanatum TaxID=34168 RepID=A0ACC2B937_DIPCM|nr:hypothetical protein O6H91_17G090500 [Diphasiastrum complanatum]